MLTAGSDKRVRVAAPSCGGMSDRYSTNPLHLATVSDPPSLKEISCPIAFLSPSNDFHGGSMIYLLLYPKFSQKTGGSVVPHHNHQDTPEYEVITQLWMDQHLKNSFAFPQTPKIDLKLVPGKQPKVILQFDESKMLSVDVYYTQQGQIDGKKIIPLTQRTAFGTMPTQQNTITGNGLLKCQFFQLMPRCGSTRM